MTELELLGEEHDFKTGKDQGRIDQRRGEAIPYREVPSEHPMFSWHLGYRVGVLTMQRESFVVEITIESVGPTTTEHVLHVVEERLAGIETCQGAAGISVSAVHAARPI